MDLNDLFTQPEDGTECLAEYEYPDEDYYNELDVEPDDEDGVNILRSAFKLARLHGLTPPEFRRILDDQGVRVMNPMKYAKAVRIFNLVKEATEGMDAVCNIHHNADVNMIGITIESKKIDFSTPKAMTAFAKAVTEADGFSVDLLINNNIRIDISIEKVADKILSVE